MCNTLGWRSSQSHLAVDEAAVRPTGVQISHPAPNFAKASLGKPKLVLHSFSEGGSYMHFVYILKLSNNEYYTGSTRNIKQRINDHKNGKNISTMPFRPLKLVYYCVFSTKSQAIKFEMYLKSGSGKAFRNKHLI